jgi:hypothetical protein
MQMLVIGQYLFQRVLKLFLITVYYISLSEELKLGPGEVSRRDVTVIQPYYDSCEPAEESGLLLVEFLHHLRDIIRLRWTGHVVCVDKTLICCVVARKDLAPSREYCTWK